MINVCDLEEREKKNWQNWNRNGKKRIGKIGIGIGKKELAKDLTLHPEMM